MSPCPSPYTPIATACITFYYGSNICSTKGSRRWEKVGQARLERYGRFHPGHIGGSAWKWLSLWVVLFLYHAIERIRRVVISLLNTAYSGDSLTTVGLSLIYRTINWASIIPINLNFFLSFVRDSNIYIIRKVIYSSSLSLSIDHKYIWDSL